MEAPELLGPVQPPLQAAQVSAPLPALHGGAPSFPSPAALLRDSAPTLCLGGRGQLVGHCKSSSLDLPGLRCDLCHRSLASGSFFLSPNSGALPGVRKSSQSHCGLQAQHDPAFSPTISSTRASEYRALPSAWGTTSVLLSPGGSGLGFNDTSSLGSPPEPPNLAAVTVFITN